MNIFVFIVRGPLSCIAITSGEPLLLSESTPSSDMVESVSSEALEVIVAFRRPGMVITGYWRSTNIVIHTKVNAQ
jgi:hypothetical protein